MFPSLSRRLLIVVLALALTVPSTVMAGSARVLPAAEDSLLFPGDVLTQAWNVASRLWEKAGCVLDPDGAKAGCRIDPDGRKAGCGIDPDGQKAGCGIDPSGSPETLTSQPLDGEAGCRIDPNGYCVK